MTFRSRIISVDALSPVEQERWREICASHAKVSHPFYTLPFAQAVGRAHGRAFVSVISEGSRIVAFFPFQYDGPIHQSLRAAQPIGADMSDYFGLVAESGLLFGSADLMVLCGAHTLLFHHLPEDQRAFGLAGEKPEVGHRIVIGADPAAYRTRLRAENKSFVAETERRQRKIIETCGPLRFEFQSEDPASALDDLIARKRAKYRRTGVRDVLAPEWKRKLLHELAASRDPQCAGVLSTLYAGDTWVASHFGLRGGHTLHYWFPVYNDDLAKFAPGHLLLKQIIENSRMLGIEVIDRGAGDQPHKTAYVTETHRFFRGCWSRRSPQALVHRAVQSLSWRLRATRDHASAPAER